MLISEQAKALAARGFHVFPCRSNSKLPAIEGFPTRASCDPRAVESLFTSQNCNIGISTSRYNGGSALVAVDVDKKDGRNGFDTISQLKDLGFDFPKTLVQRTPSGGRHLIYSNPTPVKHGTNVLGVGIDIRSRGSYIVGPGSTIDGKFYAWENDLPIAPCPEWILKKCEIKPPPVTLLPNVDSAALARAEVYLKSIAPAVKGTRNHLAFLAACKIKDFGLDLNDTFEVMAKNWKSEPAIDLSELNQCVHSAFRYGQNAPGSDHPRNHFGILPVPPSEQPKPKLYLKAFKDCIPNLNQPYLVEGLLDPGGMSVIYGESNTGKSFFAVDLGIHLALGREWHQRKVKQGVVIYVAAESGLSIERRLLAFRLHNNLGDQDVAFHLCPCQVDLQSSDADVNELITRTAPLKPSLIVVDTLARAMAGGNENQSDHMGSFITKVDLLRNATGAHVMVVHHSGKDQAKGARGHSSLRAATDTEIEIAFLTARVKKQRDREFSKPIGFNLRTVEIGEDGDGKPVTSCVVEPRTVSAEASFVKPKLTGHPAKLIEVYGDLICDHGKSPLPDWDLPDDIIVVSGEKWREAFYKSMPNETKPDTKQRAFVRAIKQLEDEGYVGRKNDWFWLRED